MPDKTRPPDRLQPLAFGRYTNWLRLLLDAGRIDLRYMPRALFVSTVSFLTIPIRLFEWARYGATLKQIEIEHPPVFIIGHWRSGTTLLHNLMSLDENLGYVTMYQTIAPDFFLVATRFVKRMIARAMPAKRVMDNMAWNIELPQEEEFALANISPYSFYHHWSFPRKASEYFRKYAIFEDVPRSTVQRWQRSYLSILKKATLKHRGKPLVIKNPTNTGRIRVLLELFPQARFIHIYRNPYIVFLSTKRLYQKTLAITQLQEIGPQEVEHNILRFYQKIMQRFLEDKALIPPENLVEVRFEDLEARPLQELQRIYAALRLPGFEQLEPVWRAYLEAQRGYRKNVYRIEREDIEKVNRWWRFALERWGYSLPAKADTI